MHGQRIPREADESKNYWFSQKLNLQQRTCQFTYEVGYRNKWVLALLILYERPSVRVFKSKILVFSGLPAKTVASHNEHSSWKLLRESSLSGVAESFRFCVPFFRWFDVSDVSNVADISKRIFFSTVALITLAHGIPAWHNHFRKALIFGIIWKILSIFKK